MKEPTVVYPDGATPREHAIADARKWQLAHAAENTPTPSDAYTVIVGLLLQLSTASAPINLDADYEPPYTDLVAANRRITVLTTTVRYQRALLDRKDH